MSQDESFDELAERIQRMQDRAREITQKRNPSAELRRGFHAKGIGVRGRFQIHSDIPKHLQIDFFRPNTAYEALVRFSNARGQVLGDLSKDQRGIAIRLRTREREALSPDTTVDIQDFLMTNTPVSFARNPRQFIEVGEILLGEISVVIPRLWKKYGFREARRILGVFLQPLFSFKPFHMNRYWSRTSYQYGKTPVRFLLQPAAGSKLTSSTQQLLDVLRSFLRETRGREHYLRENLGRALQEGDLRFDFCIQIFVDEKKTPIEDAYIEWKESDAPPIPIATLVLPKQDLDPQLEQAMERMAFNPWNTREFTPLGLINLARKKVYDASALHRGAEGISGPPA